MGEGADSQQPAHLGTPHVPHSSATLTTVPQNASHTTHNAWNSSDTLGTHTPGVFLRESDPSRLWTFFNIPHHLSINGIRQKILK